MEGATTSVIETSPDISIAKTEVFDVDFARQIADDKNVPKSDRDALKRYIKNRVRGNQVDVIYKLGKDCKHEFLGRFCALRGIGLQTLGRDIRNAICRQFYWDIDMINAQPTLLIQVCETRGLVCSALKKYCEQREELLTDVCNELNIQRWEAKQRIVSLLFGGSVEDMPTFFKNELYPELRNIQKAIWNETGYTFLKNKPNCYGKALAYFLQTEERKCLLAMDKYLSKKGRSLDVFQHDGGNVRKLPNETTFPLLRETEAYIKQETGYSIGLAVKSMETSFVKQENEDDYPEKKVEFEKEYFKLMTPPMFIRCVNDELTYLTRTDLFHQRGNFLLNDGSSFVERWITDTDIRTYERLVFSPKKPIANNEYNLFRGFATEPKEGNYAPFIELLTYICNKEQPVVEYMLKWCAHIIQKPYVKTGVCVVVQGSQGVGKDTFFNYFANILGKEYFFNTSSPENSVFANFNSGTEKCLLVKFEEANFSTNKSNADKLKKIITADTETYNAKNTKPITLDDFRNFVMTTNQEVPIVLEKNNRRFMMIEASDEKLGDTEFWDRIHRELSNLAVQSAFHHYLLHLDISNFNPQRDIVKTEYYEVAKDVFIPPYARFLQHEVHKYYTRQEVMEDCPYPEYTNKQMCDLANAGTKYEMNETKMGRDLRHLVKAGCIVKRKAHGIYKYTLEIPKIEVWLKQQGLWLEY